MMRTARGTANMIQGQRDFFGEVVDECRRRGIYPLAYFSLIHDNWAFEHHPDKNPGNEKQSEARFKEINEAFGVLGDKNKRQQYDLARKSGFAGAGSAPR